MSRNPDAAACLANDPMPDLRDWMPTLEGIAPPQVVDDGDSETAAQAIDVASGRPGDPRESVRNAARALLAGRGPDGFPGACRITGPAGATLMIDPELGVYYFESTRLLPLAVLLSLPASAWVPVYSKSLAETRDSSPAQPLARLRWFAGLVASPGELAPTLALDARFELDHWVAIEREFPRHFRIAKQFLGRATTIVAAAAAAAVPTAEVIDYVNAGIASGMLGIAA